MNIGIVGAGILGRLLAFEFMTAGHQVSIFDKKSSQNCSMAAAGLLTPVTELEKNPAIIHDLGREALSTHWPKLLSKLSEKVYFKRDGSLVLSHPQDRSDLLRYIQMIQHRKPDMSSLSILSAKEMIDIEPDLSKFNEGFFIPEEGQIDNQQVMDVLRKDLISGGVNWNEDCMVSHMLNAEIISNGKINQFDLVCDCRGLGAKDRYEQLRGVRGELIWLHAPDVNLSRPIRLIHPRFSLYIVPRPGNVYLIGASEIESEDNGLMTVRSMLELLTAAYYIHPGFADARVIKTVSQCRPTLADHLPKIKYQDNCIALNGLYRHGYLIAPTLVADLMRWMSGGLTSITYPELWERINA